MYSVNWCRNVYRNVLERRCGEDGGMKGLKVMVLAAVCLLTGCDDRFPDYRFTMPIDERVAAPLLAPR